jgi:CheY-like chemotaxis protein
MATILVVDDEPDVLESVRLVLRQYSHHVLSADNGERAL